MSLSSEFAQLTANFSQIEEKHREQLNELCQSWKENLKMEASQLDEMGKLFLSPDWVSAITNELMRCLKESKKYPGFQLLGERFKGNQERKTLNTKTKNSAITRFVESKRNESDIDCFFVQHFQEYSCPKCENWVKTTGKTDCPCSCDGSEALRSWVAADVKRMRKYLREDLAHYMVWFIPLLS
jgi:hypothetical protein